MSCDAPAAGRWLELAELLRDLRQKLEAFLDTVLGPRPAAADEALRQLAQRSAVVAGGKRQRSLIAQGDAQAP